MPPSKILILLPFLAPPLMLSANTNANVESYRAVIALPPPPAPSLEPVSICQATKLTSNWTRHRKRRAFGTKCRRTEAAPDQANRTLIQVRSAP